MGIGAFISVRSQRQVNVASRERMETVLAIDPEQAAAYVHLGVNYTAQERFAEAIAAYRNAERLHPDFAPLVQQSINLIAHLQRAKEHPDDPLAYFQLGMIYSDDGRSDRAIEAFEKVVALAPALPQGWLHLALNYEAEARYAEALNAYGQVLALEPQHVVARTHYDRLVGLSPVWLSQPRRLQMAP